LAFANTEAERLFGWSGHLPEGKLLSELVPGLAAAELTQDSGPTTITVPVSDRLFLPAVRPLSLGEGPTLVTISLRDITEHVRREEKIRDEREELIVALERSNKDLDQFAYVASHDLKAPLRGIGNLATWIQDDLGPDASDQTREHLKLMHVQVERMNALISDILAYSRVGRDTEKIEAVNVDLLLREAVEMLNLAPTAKIEIAPGMPTALPSPRTAFEQVFLNLIGNAVKHAHRDDVEVRVGVSEGEEFWEFTIADNGPGIAPESHEAIWEAFRTLDTPRKAEGTGLGLSIVKKVVERNGGRVWVESQKGNGATFHVCWPKRSRDEKR
jgi:signal transduction histidine kinase